MANDFALYQTVREMLARSAESLALLVAFERMCGIPEGRGELCATHLRKAMLSIGVSEAELTALDEKCHNKTTALIEKAKQEKVCT